MASVRFYDVLGVADAAAAANLWPRSRVKSAVGFSTDADPTDLVQYLQSALEFHALRPGAVNDRVGLSAEVVVNNPPDALIRPLVLTQMPDIAYYLLNTPGTPGMPDYRPARLYVTRADTGVELVIEGLPVEIKLPSTLLGPLRTEAEETAHPGGGPDVTLTEPFERGVYDSLQVTLRDAGESSIFAHLRVRMTEEMDFVVEPATVISIGPCRFSGLPCHGLHDVNFVPSSQLQGSHSAGEQALEWARHSFYRLPPDAEFAGFITVRTVDLDSTRAPLKQLAEKMNSGRASADRVEFVLEDIALPMWGMLSLPVPTHGQFGLRRKIEMGDDPEEAYGLVGAPVQINLGDWRLVIEQLLLRSPASLSPLDQFIFVQLALLFGSNLDTTHAATAGVTDEWTFQLGWRSPAGLSLFTLADATLKLWGAKVGWSLKRFASKDPHYQWYEQLQLLVDLGLSTKSSTLFGGAFKMRSLSGQDLELVLRDVGWNLGDFSLEGLSFPEGVQFIFADVVRLIVEELGWITENDGARYFSFSGGVAIFGSAGQADRNPQTGAGSAAVSEQKGNGGGIRFLRLRFQVAPTDLTKWRMDGATLSLRVGTFAITGFGMVSEFTDAGHTYKEFGFGIQVEFDAFAKRFLIGMQLFYGRVSGPEDNFTYWLFGFQFSPIPICTFEIINIRALVAGNMTPNLPAPDGYAQNMRLFRWYKSSGNAAITLPANRKLAAWMRKNESFALGLGAGLSLPVGKVIVLDLFVFFHKSPEESGLLIAIEVYVLKSPKPVGFGALEFDFARDKWGFMLGVALGLENVLGTSLPSFLSNLVALTGTLYAGNQPGTFAIGQLNDQPTWLTFKFDASAFIDTGVLVALCVQLVDMPGGPRGFGLVFSAKGGANFGIGAVQLYATFSLLAGVWRNESKSSGFVAWIEAGIRIKVFFIFNFGVSARIEFDYLGSPAYRRLGVELRIETPWWLPDVTFRFEKIWDEPRPELIEAISTPLLSAGAINPGAQTQVAGAVTPLIGDALDPREVYSMDQLRALGAPALPPDALDALTPVGVDSVIALNFKSSVDDKTSVGENTPAGAGTQESNDLAATYELVEIGLRRRPRFGPDAGVWTTLLAPEDTRFETPADIPSGTDLTAHFTSVVSFTWDKDLLREDRLDPRRLLVNATTPYTFLTSDPEADESLARNEPGWPCCAGDHRVPICYELNFNGTPLGVRAPSYQTFARTSSTLHWIGSRPPIVASSQAAPAGWHAACVGLVGRSSGAFATLSFDRPAFSVEIYAFWFQAHTRGTLIVEAYNGLRLLARRTFSLWIANPPPPIRFEALDGITSVLLRLTSNPGSTGEQETVMADGRIEFVQMRYCGLREELDRIAQEEKCKSQGTRALSGGGKLAWLPNHEYEISLTTKVTLNHARSGEQDVRVRQQAFFRTKGLPGLNAVARVGDELEPYVEARYPGPAPRVLYRAEPVALAFNEKFNILLPVDRTPSPDNPDELNQLLEWVLTVEKVGPATGGARVSQTSPDWVVEHRTIPLAPAIWSPVVIDATVVRAVVRQAITRDQFQMRFETMLHSPTGCNQPGPSLHHSQVLFHEPIDPGAELDTPQRWEPNTVYRVNVRRKDGPFVARNPFDADDDTAFDVSNEGGGAGDAWRVQNGRMQVSSGLQDGVRRYAVFGESVWNHVQIHTTVDPQGGAAGVAVGVAGLPSVTRAVLALIDEGARTLRLVERRDGLISALASQPLPAGVVAPYALEVLAFDDRLRAQVGETVVESLRDDVRTGRLALVAQDGGAFSSLVVEPLDAYRFQFQSSRFVSFEQHIGSFGGAVMSIPANAAGPGAATETVDTLLAATADEIGPAMAAGADPEGRQRLFDRWTRGLALPLHRRTAELEISRLVRAGKVDLLLLESPEPLPFSEDVSVALKKRTSAPPEGCLSALVRLVFGVGASAEAPRPAPTIGQQLPEAVAGLDFFGDQVAGAIVSDTALRGLSSVQQIVRTVDVGGVLEHRVYNARIQLGRRGARLSGELAQVIRPGGGLVRAGAKLEALANLRAGEIALLDGTGRPIIPIVPANRVTYVVQHLRILTNGSETQALLIPVNSILNTLTPLESGTYRFEFGIDRVRFRSQTADDTSNYRTQATIVTHW